MQKQIFNRNTEFAENGQCFEKREQAFPRFIFTNERLGNSELGSKIGLPHAGRFASLAEEGSQRLFAFAMGITYHESRFRIT